MSPQASSSSPFPRNEQPGKTIQSFLNPESASSSLTYSLNQNHNNIHPLPTSSPPSSSRDSRSFSNDDTTANIASTSTRSGYNVRLPSPKGKERAHPPPEKISIDVPREEETLLSSSLELLSVTPQSSKGQIGTSASIAISNTSNVDHEFGGGKGGGRAGGGEGSRDELVYRQYENERRDLSGIVRLCEQELSEPYFLQDCSPGIHISRHSSLCIEAYIKVFSPDNLDEPIGTIICKQDVHRGKTVRGYIAMLSIDKAWRRKGIASKLVKRVIQRMQEDGANEVVLETEYDNAGSLQLYESLGFFREKRLHRFYSNGKDAFRLFLPIDSTTQEKRPIETPKEASIAREAFSRADDFDAFVADQQDKEAQKSRTMREDMRRDNGLGDIPEEDRYFSSSQYRFDTYDETALRNGPRGDSGWMGNRDRSMRQYEDSMYT